MGFRGRDDFDDVTVLQFGSERDNTVVDLDRSGVVSDVGMDVVSEVQCRGRPWQGDDFGFRGKNVDRVGKEVDFDVFEKFSGIPCLLLDVQERLEPTQTVFLEIGQCFVFRLVEPMGGNTGFGDVVHFRCSDLEFDRSAVWADKRGVQRLIIVQFRYGDVILYLAGNGLVECV